jgi:hypothetical protein
VALGSLYINGVDRFREIFFFAIIDEFFTSQIGDRGKQAIDILFVALFAAGTLPYPI